MRRMPSVVDPMLCTLVDAPPQGTGWLFEMKWDGERCVVFVEGAGQKRKVRLRTRLHTDITKKYPEIVDDVAARLKAKNAVIDGEIVALNSKGQVDFGVLQHRHGLKDEAEIASAVRKHPVWFMAFDLLRLDGKDLTREPLESRRGLLFQIIGGCKRLKFSEGFGDGIILLEAMKKMEGEGVVAKRLGSTYRQAGRGRDWLKIKIVEEQECIIAGWTEGKGRRTAGFGALILGLYEGKGKKRRLIPVGSVGTGFDDQMIRMMLRKMRPLERRSMPFAAEPNVHDRPHWVTPKLVVQIKFANWTFDGQLRAPVFLGLRADKKAADCVREVPKKK